MNKEDRELVRFAAAWAPFGGAPPGEVFVTFGMTADRYQRRLRQILAACAVDRAQGRALNDILRNLGA
ncbi:hypothetical protein GCM10023094_53850 [Rhodococcus olei]|uniref:DUF3263 domain-containing protein n=1 Tax=Rhodococcus olei TaxID=2161675 RepID=A0ABP8PQD2_9NOCA